MPTADLPPNSLVCVVDASDPQGREVGESVELMERLVAEVTVVGRRDDLRKCAVVVLPVGWADGTYGGCSVEEVSAVVPYVASGGGLVIFQPNPLGCPGNRMRVDLFGPTFTVENLYDREDVVVFAERHPITTGFRATELPYPADRIVANDPAWTVLATGSHSGAASALALDLRAPGGRVVVVTDNPFCTLRGFDRGASERFYARALEWLVPWPTSAPGTE